MRPLSRILVLIEAASVKLRHAPCITREMCRNPVKDNADPLSVQIIHKIHEIIRRAEAAGRCIISRHLIAPRSIQRMFHDRQKFHMSIPHFLHILRQLDRDLTVIVKLRSGDLASSLIHLDRFSHPGTEMYLIDRHRRRLRIERRPFLHPVLIIPFILVQIPDDGRRVRSKFRIVRIRIRLERRVAVLELNFIFINSALFKLRDKYLKHTRISQPTHLASSAIPQVEVADDAHAHRFRRPDCKIDTAHTFDRHRMRAHLIINAVVDARLKFLQIRLRKLRCKGIRIVYLA